MELHGLIGGEIVSTGGASVGKSNAPTMTVKNGDEYFRLVFVNEDATRGGAIVIEDASDFPEQQARSERFWAWLEETKMKHSETDHGKKLIAAGFEIWHTGGGCLAWGKTIEANGNYFLITDDDAGIEFDGTFFVGHYAEDSDEAIDQTETENLEPAIEWCVERSK